MSADLQIVLTAGLVATACGLLGPFLVLRRVALLGDAVSHAVLPGIVATFLLFGTRAPLPVIVGAAVFAILCVLGIDALRATGLVKADAAIGLVFPALFSLGVLGVTRCDGRPAPRPRLDDLRRDRVRAAAAVELAGLESSRARWC